MYDYLKYLRRICRKCSTKALVANMQDGLCPICSDNKRIKTSWSAQPWLTTDRFAHDLTI